MIRVHFYDGETGEVTWDDYEKYIGCDYCRECKTAWHNLYIFKKVDGDNICSQCLLKWDKFKTVRRSYDFRIEASDTQSKLGIVINTFHVTDSVPTRKPAYYRQAILSDRSMEACYFVTLTRGHDA